MARSLAVYTMRPKTSRRFALSPRASRMRSTLRVSRNAAFILDRGGMVGKTTRVTEDGVAKAVNHVRGYLVVEAESAEAAALRFQDHPHITVFPGDAVDIMPFVT